MLARPFAIYKFKLRGAFEHIHPLLLAGQWTEDSAGFRICPTKSKKTDAPMRLHSSRAIYRLSIPRNQKRPCPGRLGVAAFLPLSALVIGGGNNAVILSLSCALLK
jgi:hypothetical protein